MVHRAAVLTHTPLTPGVGSNLLLLKVDMLQIKFKEMEHKAQCERIFCPNTQPQLPRLGQKVKLFVCQRRNINSKNLTSLLPDNTSS